MTISSDNIEGENTRLARIECLQDSLRRMQIEDPAFFYVIQGDDDNSYANVFWADATSQENYNCFGDTVRFNTYCGSQGYGVPLAAFTGLNHHGQPILFGCALLFNKSESSYVWLFQTWLHAILGRYPVSITTNCDSFIKVAIARVLPKVRHRFFGWSVFKDMEEKLACVNRIHPAFESELKKCVYEAETVGDFDSSWHSLLERYHLMDNGWLQSLYNERHQWVPIYMRDTFFGEFSSAEAIDSMDCFFEGFLNASSTIQMLISQCDKAAGSWHERELRADMDTANIIPVLKTRSPMEKQAANLYTREIFMKFQGELVETLAYHANKIDDSGSITKYHVAKFGEEHKVYVVNFNTFEMTANCSCQKFEFSGIICRHILSVFRAKNVFTLPSLYILRRWTRDARINYGGVGDDCSPNFSSDSRESRTARYNNLRAKAITFVEEGAKSIHAYYVARNALAEAAKKVAVAKRKGVRAPQGNSQANGSNANLSLDQKERRISELTAELQRTNQRCEAYRGNLLALLRDMEDQKLKLSVKVQNARLSLKE
ncbi:OLC1v1030728C1 [Oldenlandia corymbosa var. corymbosa]|nr:OLC1v1030728C1 [Oldenlandia corymbosa var. corymbosa]